ncbi:MULTISPECIES: thiamine-monophosphate kinase [unclassified Sphingomonas]|uniref:thiamine-phosphate kinase n=1 Tax=unclassified Sphingomonas TaxID=196159 RepID=UPI000BDC27C5|nr:MAG: thiamine-phosphate kinase [Sphingomonas sp. 12-62-6]OYX36664.1 MAG: thiamine-phosphate kinase [Sphingomonas sp. 32-62-10]
MTEADFLAALRALPLHPGAQGLADDVARLGGYVLTTDTLVEGVHFLASDPAHDVAWKLLAVNLSDLAAKGADPVGVLLNYPLGDDAWDRDFLAGFDAALRQLGCQLLGGDTVSLPQGAPRVMTLTAIGHATHAPSRSGARAGDGLFVTGTIGDSGAGLAIAQGELGLDALLNAYRRPLPRLGEGRILAAHVHAMMDVSDGLLIDAARMAAASGLAVTIDLAVIPLSDAYRAHIGDDRAARLRAATAGDDYQLLFAAPASLAVPARRIGSFAEGQGLTLTDGAEPVPLPMRLGFEHGGA